MVRHTTTTLISCKSYSQMFREESFEGEESESYESCEGEESEEDDNLQDLVDYGNQHGGDPRNRVIMKNGLPLDKGDMSQDSEEMYSYTILAGNKVIERTEDQVVQNTKTYRRFIIKGTMNNPEGEDSEGYDGRGNKVNLNFR